MISKNVDNYQCVTDPDRIYALLRCHLFEMGDHLGLKRLKRYYAKLNKMFALEIEFTLLDRECDLKNKIYWAFLKALNVQPPLE